MRSSELPATATEDYLKTIYQHTEWQPDAVTPSILALRLGVAPASVTGMIKKLAAAGLVDHEPYGPLALSTAGTAIALNVIRRHRLVETWLVSEMGYAWHEVHHEAEVLEHSVSDRLLAAIDARLRHPLVDPHGDPIPRADGTVDREHWMPLTAASDGLETSLLRVSDRNPDLLEILAAGGIRPGTRVRVEWGAGTARAAALVTPAASVPVPADRVPDVWLRAV